MKSCEWHNYNGCEPEEPAPTPSMRIKARLMEIETYTISAQEYRDIIYANKSTIISLTGALKRATAKLEEEAGLYCTCVRVGESTTHTCSLHQTLADIAKLLEGKP